MREPVYDSIGLTEIDVTKNIRTATVASEELIASVRKRGVNRPVLVRLAPPGSDYVYEMLDGHRRHAAATACGLETIPARIFDLTDREHREIQFECEGLHEALGPLDRARALRALIDEHGLTQEEAGALVEGGRSQEWVSNCLRLLELPATVQELISRQIISASGGVEVLRARRLPKAMKAASDQLEGLAQPGVEISVEMVRNIVAAAIDEHSKDLGTPGGGNGRLLFDVAACKDCENRVRGRNDDRCGEPKCWREKQAAGRVVKVEEAKVRARAGNPDFGDDQFLTAAFDDCPKGCKDRRKTQGYNGTTFRCLAPDSDCYRERKAAQPVAAKAVKLDPAEQRARDEEWNRARRESEDAWRASEAGRLKRVRAYLEKRAELTEDETRLLCLVAIERHVQRAEFQQAVGWRLRDLVRRALAHALEGEPARAWDDTLRRWVPLPRPTRYDALRHGLIGWTPGGVEDPDSQTDPESPADPNHDPDRGEALPIAEALGVDGEAVFETDPDSEIPGHVETAAEPPPIGPNPAVTLCAERGVPTSPEECLTCCREGKPPCCPLVLAAGQAPFHCPGGLACPTLHVEPDPPAAADQPELAPLELAKAAYGANPGIKKCPVPGELAIVDNPEACLICCSSQRGATKRCCRAVTSGSAPFHCPGGLDTCPTAVGGVGEEGDADARG